MRRELGIEGRRLTETVSTAFDDLYTFCLWLSTACHALVTSQVGLLTAAFLLKVKYTVIAPLKEVKYKNCL